MKIISFAWTSNALKADRKSRTRREWNDEYASQFKVGDLCQAYDKSPRYGGKIIAVIRITGIKKEDISLMPDEDYEREGFKFMEENEIKIWKKNPRTAFDEWREEGGECWVLDFEIVHFK